MGRHQLRFVLAAAGAAVLVAVFAYAASAALHVPPKVLTRDPYLAAKVPPYYGWLSLLGSGIWLAGGLVPVAVAQAVRTASGAARVDGELYRLLLFGGLLGTAMAVDDLLLFHDAGADYLRIPEKLFHLTYGAAGLALLVGCRRALARTPWVVLVAALGGFALSSGMDALRRPPDFLKQAEDVPKLAGIVLWTAYFLYAAAAFAQDARARRGDGRADGASDPADAD